MEQPKAKLPSCAIITTRVSPSQIQTSIWTAKEPQNLLDTNIPGHRVWKRCFSSKPLFLTAGLLLFGFVWEFSPPRDSAWHVAGACSEPDKPCPTLSPKSREAQAVTKERSLELKLRLYLLNSDWVQRWEYGIKQGQDGDCSSRGTEDVVYNFPFLSFSFWPPLREGLCWSTRTGCGITIYRSKQLCFYEAGNTNTPKPRRGDAARPDESRGWPRDRGICHDIPARDTRASTDQHRKALGSVILLRYSFQRRELRSRIPQSDRTALNRYSPRAGRTVCGISPSPASPALSSTRPRD